MSRRFREHDVRQVTDLSGFWDFAFLGEAKADKVDINKIKFNDIMAVPCCFDATPAYAGKRGLTAYRRRVLVADTAPHRLVLDGVHHWCRVFVDNQPICDHSGGFTRFSADFVPAAPGLIEVVVLVDNRFGSEYSPLHIDRFDWYHFGGIARSVQLHRLGDLWINSVQIVTENYAKRRINVTIDYAAASAPGKTHMEATCAGSVISSTLNIKKTSGKIELSFELPGAELWSPQSPALHELHIKLGNDDIRERFGIRQVRVKGQDILINGKAVRLLGFCRHEIHTQFGHGLPDAVMLEDVQQLRDMGCNFVRGSHYPQDIRFLDLCDEMGICVWCETTGWGQVPDNMRDERYVSAVVTNAEEMVAAAYNRPSVIMWGTFNEGCSNDPEGRVAYKRVLSRIRELDPTRPLTFATNRIYSDICLDLADIISVNIYPGWYDGELDHIAPALDNLNAHLKKTGCDKPLIISEIGAAALYGFRDINNGKWTEQYQADLLNAVIRHLFVDNKRASGLSIWQFCDMRTSKEFTIRRARTFNNKGVLDEYRRPKMAYAVVKDLFRKIGWKK
ncbi:MAG: hypothetical protein EHM48_03275 [Planctomycetaceae bacterium]|nr:MAG: hypothetical protein EHM48_03275 [Planctomycetaceae bacterium]